MKVARVVLLGALACASIAGVAATRLNGISKGAPVVPLVKVTLGGAADPCSEALGSCYGWCGPGAAGECKAQCMDTFNKCNQDPGYVNPDDGPDPNDPDFRPNNPAPSEDPDDGAKVAVAVSSDGDFGPIETCEMGCNDLEGKCVAHCPMGDMTCIAPCQDAAKECLGVCPGCGEDCTSTFKACVASGSSPASCSMAQNACLANCPLTVAATAPVAACDPTKLPDCLKTCTDAFKPCLIACGPQNQACTATCVTSFKTCGQDCACNPSAAPAVESAEDVHTTILPESEYRAQFTAFVKKYNKKYSSDEFFSRYAIFKANLNKIRVHHSIRSTFRMAVNEFADMTFAEFHSKMTGYNRRDKDVLRKHNAEGPHSKLDVLASSVDWRQKNAVTPVKNQQQCGSCWAFSTTGSTEGAHAIKTGNLVSLSEQQLVDCSSAQGNQGCNGGMMDQGFQYIITNGGITTEDAYPYTAQQGTCQTNVTVAATLSSFVDVTPGSETALMQAVNLGPVSVAIEADQQCFQFYSGGILSDPSCGTNLDHGVLVVGYGTDNTVSPPANYWIVKNSWGESWGENGYIRLSRGNNECGIATEPSYPVV